MGIKEDLIAIVGSENFVDDSDGLRAYSKDYSLTKPSMPNYAVRPVIVEEIQEIVKHANKYKIPLTPCSSGVHFNGNTVPLQGGIIVDLRRMNKILRVDERNRAIRIEPGVTWIQLQDELAKHDLMALTPLLPHSQKSALSSHLEREPMLIPKFEYGDPILNVEAILPKGELFRSGSACVTGFPDESAADGVNPQGPGIDWVKLFQGAQGTFGIVTWGIVKAEVKPKVDKTFFIPFNTVDQAVEATYRIQKSMIGSECLMLNCFNLAAIMAEKWPKHFEVLRQELAPWTLILVLAGGWRHPEDRIEYEEEVLNRVAFELSIPKLPSVLEKSAGLETGFSEMLRNTWPESKTYWKFGYKGSCQDLYFHTSMSRIPKFTNLVREVAAKNGYPINDIGFYIQPIERGRVCHFECNFYYDPEDLKAAEGMRELYSEAADALICNEAFITRPYGPVADMVYDRAASYTMALKKTKNWLDPNNIMGSGKLCF